MQRSQIVEAFILAQRNYGEADRLYIIYAKQLGKVTVIAKGVRRITSRRAGNLDVLNYVTVTLARGQTFPIVTEAAVIDSFQPLKENLSKSMYASYIVELINTLTAEQEVSLAIFNLLKETLTLFAGNARRIIILGFEIKLLTALGFFNVQKLPTKNHNLVAIAGQIQVQSQKEVAKLVVSEHDFREISGLVRKQLIEVAEKEFKSPKILAQLRQQIERQGLVNRDE